MALQLPVSILGFSDAHQSLCKMCVVKLLLYSDIAAASNEIYFVPPQHCMFFSKLTAHKTPPLNITTSQTITRHGRPVKIWISTRVEVLCIGL